MNEATQKAFVMNALLMAYADGNFDPTQRTLVRAFLKKAGVPTDKARKWFLEMQAGNLELHPVQDHAQAVDMLKLVIGVAASDQKLDAREKSVLLSLSKAVGISNAELQTLVRTYWKRDVLPDILKPPPAPPVTSDIVVISDHFESVGKLQQTAASTKLDALTLAQLPSRPAQPTWVLFHGRDSKEETLEDLAEIRRLAPDARAVGVVSRHQGYLVSYLLEGGAYRCLVEDIYPGEIERLVASLSSAST